VGKEHGELPTIDFLILISSVNLNLSPHTNLFNCFLLPILCLSTGHTLLRVIALSQFCVIHCEIGKAGSSITACTHDEGIRCHADYVKSQLVTRRTHSLKRQPKKPPKIRRKKKLSCMIVAADISRCGNVRSIAHGARPTRDLPGFRPVYAVCPTENRCGFSLRSKPYNTK
jgi:hypothetical protein